MVATEIQPPVVALVRRESTTPTLLEPIVEPSALVSAHKKAARIITEALEEGVDYGTIPGAGSKPTLLKPGAERLRIAFGLSMRFVIVEHEHDHDRQFAFVDKYGKDKTSLGLYRAVVKCILSREGVDVGEGDGVCSSLESKYISRPRDVENTVVKMAEKRAFVAAILFTLGLSNRFTQDVEDFRGGDPDEQPARAPAQKPAPTPQLAAKPTPEEQRASAFKWALGYLAKIDGAKSNDDLLVVIDDADIEMKCPKCAAAKGAQCEGGEKHAERTWKPRMKLLDAELVAGITAYETRTFNAFAGESAARFELPEDEIAALAKLEERRKATTT